MGSLRVLVDVVAREATKGMTERLSPELRWSILLERAQRMLQFSD